MVSVRFTHQAIDAHARARVTERTFNCNRETQDVVPLRYLHSSFQRGIAQKPYLYVVCK
jgi:hypothetical protein